jgi:hypothetical protein
MWSQDFTAKLFCNVEFWIERLPKLIGLCESTGVAIPGLTLSTGQWYIQAAFSSSKVSA